MPLHLKPLDMSAELEGYESVLIVSCPVCPPVSLASDKGMPLMEFFKSGIKTRAYEDHIRDMRESLEQRGVKTGVFTSHLPTTAMCLWTTGQRNRLLKRAKGYQAAVVMGCESGRYTVEEALRGTGCTVLLAMQLVGITNAKLKFGLPVTVKLEDLARVDANAQGEVETATHV